MGFQMEQRTSDSLTRYLVTFCVKFLYMRVAEFWLVWEVSFTTQPAAYPVDKKSVV